MRDYRRLDPSFSLCGLCCCLCPIHRMEGGCPGCGGGAGHQGCAIIRCALDHGAPESCALCPDFPCPRLEEAARFDSFVPHREQLAHLRRQAAEPEAFRAGLAEKSRLLTALLEGYNDGRRKSFFCTAVNLLPAGDTAAVLAQLDGSLPLKARSAQAVRLLTGAAEARGLSLKLNRKPKH